MEYLNEALKLMVVGMATVFAILLIVIYLGKALIAVVNKYVPEEVQPAHAAAAAGKPAPIPPHAMAAIAAACVHARAGKICGSKEGVLGCLPLDLCNYVRDLINAKC